MNSDDGCDDGINVGNVQARVHTLQQTSEGDDGTNGGCDSSEALQESHAKSTQAKPSGGSQRHFSLWVLNESPLVVHEEKVRHPTARALPERFALGAAVIIVSATVALIASTLGLMDGKSTRSLSVG